jgi:hypothetical protein
MSIGANGGKSYVQLGDGWAFGVPTILPVLWTVWLTFRLWHRVRAAPGFEVLSKASAEARSGQCTTSHNAAAGERLRTRLVPSPERRHHDQQQRRR